MNENLSLGLLIGLLERRDPSSQVVFDFAGHIPTKLESYRGYYDQLALGYTTCGRHDDHKLPTVSDVLETLRSAVGKTFQGWKGGTYRMDTGTPLWVDNPGECNSTAIVGLDGEGTLTVITTRYVR